MLAVRAFEGGPHEKHPTLECGSEFEEDRESPTERTALDHPSPPTPKYLRNAPVRKLHHPTERSVIPAVVTSTLFVVVGLAVGLPLVALLTVAVLVAGLVRMTAACCCGARGQHGSCGGLVSAADAFWLHDSDFNRSVAHCLFFVEKGLDVRAAREILQGRVIEKTTENGERAFARFTQKVVSVAAGYCWVDDPHFCIERHVFEEGRRARSSRQLRDLIAQLMGRPLRPDRPLWELRLVHDYGRARDTVLVARVHRALGDGVALVKVLANFLADHPQMLRLKPRAGGAAFPLNAFRAAAVAPLTLLAWLLGRRPDHNALAHRQPLRGRRAVGWSAGIRCAAVDRIRQVTHCTVNDVLVAAARGAIRDYFRHQCGVRSPPDVTMNIPLDLRFEPVSMEAFPELGAGFAVVNARLPVSAEGAIPGLWESKRQMDKLKASCDPVVMYGTVHYLGTLMPACLCRWMVRTVLRGASLSFCSLPGPERPVTLASHRVKSAAFWMDAHPEAPLAFCVFSYAGNFYVSVSADSGTVPEPRLLLKGFIAHLDRMYSIVARRKIPGQERRRSSFTAERRREEIFKPSVKEINAKLNAVQDELHEISRKLELTQAAGFTAPPDGAPMAAWRRALRHRMEELKEEFVELISELRKRKALAGGIAVHLEDPHYDDSDPDGAMRRGFGRRPSLTALSTLLSTSRPLLTHHAPASLPQDLLHQVPSDPDLEIRGTPEQRRALLDRRKEECYVSRSSGSSRRETLY